MDFEAALARQEADYLAVAEGELSVADFLHRHIWSPYRRSVSAMGAIEDESPSESLESASPPDGP